MRYTKAAAKCSTIDSLSKSLFECLAELCHDMYTSGYECNNYKAGL